MDDHMSKPKRRVMVRVMICTLVLAAGIIGMLTLARMKQPPAEAAFEERPIQVETLSAQPEDVQVVIRGFGEARPLDIVVMSPEIAGRVLQAHPRLDAGEVVSEGEVLVTIDPRNYQAAHDDARARADQIENTILRLEKELEIARKRLTTLKRNRALAGAEFKRLKRLYRDDKVGTRSGVDQAEQAYNSAADQADLLSERIELYPIRVQESRAALASALAGLDTAAANLDRCEIRAPFSGRIKSAGVKQGQYVSPGQQVLTLANDAILEIQVPIDSRDARKWLRFDDASPRSDDTAAWFSGLAQVPCDIRWTEDSAGRAWTGRLHRVVKFDPQTRTLTVAVRITASEARMGGGFPLVEGMFCSVAIPGKTLDRVIRLPRWAVTFKQTVYTARGNRLNTLPVTVAWIDGEEAFVSKGIQAGQEIIVTRLSDPLENALLEIISRGKPEGRP